MPIYRYSCKECNHKFEKIQKFNSRVAKKCPECSKLALEKQTSKTTFRCVGTGWYKDGYQKY